MPELRGYGFQRVEILPVLRKEAEAMKQLPINTIVQGDALSVLKTFPDESVHCAITSPPYWGLRDYGTEPLIWGGKENCQHVWGDKTIRKQTGGTKSSTLGELSGGHKISPEHRELSIKTSMYEASQGQFCQLCGAWRGNLGLEPSPELYVEHIVEIFREVKRVLRKDGTFWLNMGDSYAGSPPGNKTIGVSAKSTLHGVDSDKYRETLSQSVQQKMNTCVSGLKQKDLCGIPWRVAFALQADGWWLRSDIIWHKPNPMPESIRDRPTRSHEYVFLLTKSKHYYYDAEAIKEPSSQNSHARGNGVNPKAKKAPAGWDSGPGDHSQLKGRYPKSKQNPSFSGSINKLVEKRNKRSVWTIATQPFTGAHFAVFPEKLISPMILAGTKEGDIVLDPFSGAGTVALVAEKLGRNHIGIELKTEYIEMTKRRLKLLREQTRLI